MNSSRSGLDVPGSASAVLLTLRHKHSVCVEVYPASSHGSLATQIDLLAGPHHWCASARDAHSMSDNLRGYAQDPVLRRAVLASIEDRVSNYLLAAEKHDQDAKKSRLDSRRTHETKCAQKLREEADTLSTLLTTLTSEWPEQAS